MNRCTCPATCTRTRLAATAAFALTLGVLAIPPAGHSEEPATAAAKDQFLFNGTDFMVGDGTDFYRLVGAKGEMFQIVKERKVQDLERSNATGIRFIRGQKLSQFSANISNLKEKRIPAANDNERSGAIGSMAAYGIEGVAGTTDDLIVSSSSAGSQAFFNRFSYPEDVQVTFEISAPRPMARAYLVLIVAYSRSRKDAPMVCKFTVQPIENLGPEPQKVRIVQSGFPNPFDLKGSDVKIYAEGHEVATNLLTEQIALTKDEAHEYFVRSYVSSHEGATAPPGLLMLTPASTLSSQVDKAQLDKVVFVTVDAHGALLGAAADESGGQKLSSETESLMQHIRFMPALDKGVPVEGHLRLNLAKLLL